MPEKTTTAIVSSVTCGQIDAILHDLRIEEFLTAIAVTDFSSMAADIEVAEERLARLLDEGRAANDPAVKNAKRNLKLIQANATLATVELRLNLVAIRAAVDDALQQIAEVIGHRA
jgi:hypothetical protein